MTQKSTSSTQGAVVRKAVVATAVAVVLGVLMRRLGSRMRNVDWEKALDQMPDNAPPKWMFRNINVIRENTDRILETLEVSRPGAAVSASTSP